MPTTFSLALTHRATTGPRRVAIVPLTIGLCLGLALGAFTGGALQSIYPYVAGTLATSSDHALWTLTYFLIHWALGIALMPWFSRRLGFKRLFMLSMVVLAASSLFGVFTTSLMLMLVVRGAQGISAGMLVPMVQTLLLQNYPKRRHALATALWSNSMLVPFFFGPAFGGWLATNYSWLDIFWLVLPTSVVAMALVQFSMPADPPKQPAPRFDLVGLALLWPGLITLQIVLNQGEQFGWFGSPFILRYSVIAGTLLVLFIIWELFEAEPLLQLRFLAQRNFGFGLALLCLGWSIFVGWSSILPLWSETDLGFNGWWGGVLLIPLAITAIPVASVIGHLARVISMRFLAASCFVFFAISFGFAFYSPAVGLAATIPSELLQGIAVGMLFVPLTMIVLSEIPPEDIATASTTSNFIRLTSDIIGVTMLTTLWQRETVRIADQIRNAMHAGVVHQWAAHMHAADLTRDATLMVLAHRLNIQAETLSLDQALRLSAYISIGAAVITLLVLRAPRPAGSLATVHTGSPSTDG